MTHPAQLPAQMRDEARRMDERAAHYRQVADELDAKAEALRRRANRIGGIAPAGPDANDRAAADHPWRNKGMFKGRAK